MSNDEMREITLPRPNGRPDYTTIIAASAIHVSEGRLSVELSDEQIAEWAEIPLDDYLGMKAKANE